MNIYTIIILLKYVYLSVCLSACLPVCVGVSKLQVAILARSSREIHLTVRIDWQYILSQVCVSVRPRIFLYAEKHPKTIAKARVSFYWMNAAKCGHRSAPPGHQTRSKIAITPATDRTKMRVYTFTPGGAIRDKSLRCSWRVRPWRLWMGLLATNAFDRVHAYTGVYKLRCRARQKRRKTTSQYSRNDNLYLHGLKSVV